MISYVLVVVMLEVDKRGPMSVGSGEKACRPELNYLTINLTHLI
jgi:hypothetical protein